MRRPRTKAEFYATFRDLFPLDLPPGAEDPRRSLADFAGEFTLIYATITLGAGGTDEEISRHLRLPVDHVRQVRRQIARDDRLARQ